MKKLTQQEFIKKAINKHNNSYDYTNTTYINSRTPINIICNSCNRTISIKANNHLQGQGCKPCSMKKFGSTQRKTLTTFIAEANKIHNSKYNYTKVSFTNNKNKVEIICPQHGTFIQTVNHHLRGRGCPTCGRKITKERLQQNPNLYSYTGWEVMGNKSNYFNGFSLYIIKCWNDNECFYKIGKTFTTVNKRFNARPIPYEWKLIKVLTGSAKYISELENKLHNLHKQYKYNPNINFKGETECFSQLIEKINDL